jgi:hypothetical protein
MGAFEEMMRDYGETPEVAQRPVRRAPPRAVTRQPARTGRVYKDDGVGAFFMGVADTVTFGYLDEAGAWVDSKLTKKTYAEALADNRRRLGQAQEKHGGAYLGGQVAGAFLPISVASKAKGLKGMVAAGTAEGALYGSGSATEGNRVRGALEGAAWGFGGGLVIGGAIQGGRTYLARGKTVKVKTPAPRAVPEPAPVVKPVETPKVSLKETRATPKDIPEVPQKPVREDGAILAPEELIGDPAAARAAIDRRLGRMTQEAAMKMAGRLDAAEAAGEIIDDPHYRSLLHVGLDGEDIDQEKVLQAAEILEEATEAIQEKAGALPRTMGSIDQQTREAFSRGIVLDDLEEAVERSRKGIADARVASHVMTLSAVQFSRAKDELLPLIRAGTEGAREQLTESLTKAAQLFSMAKTISGNTGRALRAMRGDMELQIDDVADDIIDLEDPKAIRARVGEALKELNDEDLADLMGRIKDENDIARIGNLIQSKEDAAAFSKWRRVRESAGVWLRSNALSPATGIFNGVSAVVHDFFRNDLSRMVAARNLAKAGHFDEATIMRLELKVARSVYWETHRRGFAEMMKRIKWEALTDIEKIAGVGIGSGRIAAGAKNARVKMASEGYVPPVQREYEKRPGISIADHEAFQAKLNDMEVEGGSFAKLYANTLRAGAAAVNTVDALGGASMKLLTSAIDDWGRGFVTMKETYALSARFAAREGMELGLTGEELAEFVQKRAVQLAEMPNADIMRHVEDTLLKGDELDAETRFLANREKAVELEADRTLFVDGPQTAFGQTSEKLARGADRLAGLGLVEGVLIPYVRTPIRLFERGMVSYTPWAAQSDEVRKILAKGGPEADIVNAQIELGGHALKLGMFMGLTGTLHLTNGEWGNTKGLDEGRPTRLQIGSAYVEIGRLDPFALTLAIGGLLGQAIKEGFQDGTEYDAETGIQTGMQIAFLASRDAILSKSYLTGLRDLTEILINPDTSGSADAVGKLLTNVSQRMIPLAGSGRMVNDTTRSISGVGAIEAVGWTHQMLRAIPGAGLFLPVRRDILGDPIKSRAVGIEFGLDDRTGDGKEMDDVKRTLRDLEITLQDLRRADPRGFDFTGEQLDQLRYLRGHEATNAEGLTLREALAELFADEYFQMLPEKEQRRNYVSEVIREFNEPARALLEEQDPTYASNREGWKSFMDYMDEGFTERESKEAAIEEVEAFGLPTPDL